MKKSLLLLMALFLLTRANLFANSWEILSEPNIPFSINSIDMPVDSLTGWAVCDQSNILYTEDGWSSWRYQHIGTEEDYRLYDVDFVDNKYGWAVGGNFSSGSVIYSTKNGGNTWSVLEDSVTALALITVSAVDSNHVWCAGNEGQIYYLNSAGNWVACNIQNSTPIKGIHMVDSLHGVAVCSNADIFRTTDGINWHPADSLADAGGRALNAVWMRDVNDVWAVGSGNSRLISVFLHSADGGRNWTRWMPNFEINDNIKSVRFSKNGMGIAVGAKGRVLLSSDGENWNLLPRKFANQSEDVAIIGSNIWAVGGSGIIQYSADLGENWNMVTTIAKCNVYKLSAISAQHIMGVGYASSVLESRDGGLSWNSKSIIANEMVCSQLWGIDFANDLVGWVCGSRGFLAKTSDAGNSWEYQGVDSITGGNWLRDVCVIDDKKAWCCGYKGTALRTNDGGNSWVNSGPESTAEFFQVKFFDSDNGLLCGNGALYYTSNAGESWNPSSVDLDSAGAYNFISCHASDLNHIWLLDKNGHIFTSDDHGHTFQHLAKIDDSFFTSLFFIDNQKGWISTQHGSIYHSTDGGINWDNEFTHSSALTWITSADMNSVMVAGFNGYILSSPIQNTVAALNVKSPATFVLFQNYPNPFNASTNISFQVREKSHIRLQIFNVLGELVTNLVNEKKEQGNYTIPVDASEWSSGIYFIQMKTDKFLATKRMILLK